MIHIFPFFSLGFPKDLMTCGSAPVPGEGQHQQHKPVTIEMTKCFSRSIIYNSSIIDDLLIDLSNLGRIRVVFAFWQTWQWKTKHI